MKRRNFINTLPSISMLTLLDWHGCFQGSAINRSFQGNNKPYIQQLHLETATPLDQLANFYHQQIGFPIIAEQPNSITFQTGQSQLIFQKIAKTEKPPFYHFAFNIPENKILAARAWQAERCPLIQTPNHMTDTQFPKDIRHFRNWNAHSVFFWDPAGNLVEYIARHDLNNAIAEEFSSKAILYISEIAFIVEDVNKEARHFSKMLSIKEYRTGSNNFRAMGDEMGLLLLMKKGRIWESQTKQAKTPTIFSTRVKLTKKINTFDMLNYPYQIN